MPKALFTNGLTKMLGQMARMPTRRHTGKRLRASLTIPLPAHLQALLAAEVSTSHGLPGESAEVGIERVDDGSIKPTKTLFDQDR